MATSTMTPLGSAAPVLISYRNGLPVSSDLHPAATHQEILHREAV